MQYIADLHIHSPYSRATSKLSHLHGLAAWAAIKGINVVGTGDFTHPGWLNHLLENLEEAEPGFFRLKNTAPESFKDAVPEGLEPDVSGIRFVLTSEISSIYKRGGKVRKVHNMLFSPDFDSVRRMNAALAAIGNIESDGRPILGLDSRNLLEILLEKMPEGFLVPAHIWTPWFSLFGSKSGFDSIEECFGDLTSHIFALETGLSSDPDMNRTISALDKYSLLSNSDCHSPGKLGREANVFSTGFDYFSMRDALKKPVSDNGKQNFAATIEFFPEEGKYHCDGHRKCGVCMEPEETKENKGVCPECGRPVTVGVLYRVNELADRSRPVYLAGSPAVHSLVPLPELLSELLQVGPASKTVMRSYVKLIQRFGSEFTILLDVDSAEIEHGSSSFLAESVKRVRSGNVIRQPGYDGEFGIIRVFSDRERKSFGGQMNLFGTEVKRKPKKRTRSAKKVSLKTKVPKRIVTLKKKELNPEQLKVIDSEEHHIIVKAGPGTGKTHTLVQRLVRLAARKDFSCSVITFTNKAAQELQERLFSIIGENNSIHVSTLHGYCLKWLRRLKPDIAVAGPEMRQWFMRRLLVLDRLNDSDLQGFDKNITEFLKQAPDFRGAAPDCLEPYFSLLESEGFVDIDAVVSVLASCLYDTNTISETIRKETGMVFIDEFQDLNQSQYELVRLLAQTSPVFAIGDPDQAIYGFRGSSPVWFYKFIQDLQPMQFSLYRNYRSAQKIVEAANQVICHNHHETTGLNESFTCTQGKIFLKGSGTPRDEADFIVRQIEKLTGGTSHREIERIQHTDEQPEVSLGDIAVLYRTSRQAEIIASSLYEHGFPVQVVDVKPYFLSATVYPLYLWSLFAAGQADGAHFLKIMEREAGIGKSRLSEIEQSLPRIINNIFDQLDGLMRTVSKPVEARLQAVVALRKQVLQVAEISGVVAALQLVVSTYGLDNDDPDIVRFFQMADNFGTSFEMFAGHLLHHSDSVVYDERAEAVTLMTLHASKGLEFKVVFLAGLEEGILPLSFGQSDVHESNEHIEEERRLFYVGMTRAEEILYLSYVQQRGNEEPDSTRPPSRFLKEIHPGLFEVFENKPEKRKGGKQMQQLNLFETI